MNFSNDHKTVINNELAERGYRKDKDAGRKGLNSFCFGHSATSGEGTTGYYGSLSWKNLF